MRQCCLIIVLFLSVLTSAQVIAQVAEADSVLITNYRSESGLPGVPVDFYMDSKGLLWIAGQSNQTRLFDGQKFRAMGWTNGKEREPIQFSSIVENDTGRLLMVSWPNTAVSKITAAGTLEPLENIPNNYFVRGYPYYFDWRRFISSGATTLIRNDRNGLMGEAAGADLFRLLNDSTFIFRKDNVLYLYYKSRKSICSIPYLSALDIQWVDGNFLYVFNNKLYRYDPVSNVCRLVSLYGDIAAAPSDAAPVNQTKYSAMTIIRGLTPHVVYNSKLFRLVSRANDSIEGRFVCVLNFLHSSIDKVEYYKQQEITVLSTQLEGLFFIRKAKFPLDPVSKQFTKLKKDKVFFPVLADRQGAFQTVWASFSPGKRSMRTFMMDEPNPFGHYVDKGGYHWTTGKENRLFKLDSNRKKIREYSLPESGYRAVDFGEDELGNIYVLTNNSVARVSEKGISTLANTENLKKNGKRIVLQNLSYAGHGIFYIGSSKGLYSFYLKDAQFRKLPELSDHFILNSRCIDEATFLFTVIQSDTLFIRYNNKFFALPLGDELGAREIMAVQPDGRGRVWFSTDNGLYVTSSGELVEFCKGGSKEVFFYKYDRTDGLAEMEFNGGLHPSSAIDRDGWLAFNSISGVVLFHQDSIQQLFPLPMIELSKWNGGFIKWVVPGDTLFIENDQAVQELELTLPFYGNKDNLRLAYKIDNADGQWTRLEEARLSLAKLDYGEHRLLFRLKTGFGAGNYFTKEYLLYVKPFFYQKLQFKIFMVILGLLLLLFIIVTRMGIRKRNLMIQQQTAALLQANASLEAKSRNLEEFAGKMEIANQEILLSKEHLQDNILVKEKLMSLILHDLRSPLYSQSLILNQMINAPSLSMEDMRSMFMQVKQSNEAILKFTHDFLTWYSSQKNGFIVNKCTVDIGCLMEEILVLYRKMAALKNIAICFPGTKEIVFSDRNILEVILRNILDNAIKYTAAGSVSISCYRTEKAISVTVTDTGPGIPVEILSQLDMYNSLETQYTFATFGYRFILSLSQKIGASVHVTNHTDGGAMVKLELPFA